MSLSSGMDMRMEQRQDQYLMCLLPLLGVSLSNLSRVRKEVEKMTPEELNAFGTLSRGGKGGNAFYDHHLIDVLGEMNAFEIREPDVRVVKDGDTVAFEYTCSAEYEEYKPTLIDTESFIRNPFTLLRNINWVIGTTKKMYDRVLKRQRNYLSTNNVSLLESCTQETIANDIAVSPSTASRLLKGKSIRSLDGYIMPLSSLILNQQKINQLRVYEIMGNWLRNGTYSFSDDDAVREIYTATGGEKGGIRLARRTVSKYRKSIEGYLLKKSGDNPDEIEERHD